MAKKSYLVALVLLGMSISALALSCRPCGTFECSPSPTNCPAGLVRNACGCCFVCGKTEGESCGFGLWRILGACGNNLKCVVHREISVVGVCRNA